ncbi:MAG: hypothetical protein HKN71_08100 [Gemmatimonadetes bacterium]|nr:hypothetical protein [Gemmatimonadota bacterium]
MTRPRAAPAFNALLVVGPLVPVAPVAAHAPDWMPDVPVRVSSLDPVVRHVVLTAVLTGTFN